MAQCESEEEWCKAREKQMKDDLAPKTVSFFQMEFEGVVRQFVAQGYPPLEEYADFIDIATTLSEAFP